MKQYTVAVVGSGLLFREGIQTLLRRPRFMVVSSSATLAEALNRPLGTAVPALAVCTCASADDATALIASFSEREPAEEEPRLVLLADGLSAETLRIAAAAGVQAVLSNNITGEVLQRSLELVMLGQQLFPRWSEDAPPRPGASLLQFTRPTPAQGPSLPGGNRSGPVSTLQGDSQRFNVLSDRERQILLCLVHGAANKMIARDLQITEATVKVHIKGLLRKIRVSNRTQAAVWGLNNNLASHPGFNEPGFNENVETFPVAASCMAAS